MKKLVTISALVAAVLLFPSCKRDNAASPDFGQGTGHCRLVTIDHPNYPYYGTTQLSYDSADRLSQVTNVGGGHSVNTFHYHDSTIIVSTQSGIIDSIILDASGQIAYESYGLPGPHNGFERFFSYNNQHQLTHFSVRQNGFTTGDSYFFWENGNMIKDSFGVGATLTYSYNDAKFQYAAQQQLSDFLTLGTPMWKPRNLPSSFTATTTPGTVAHTYTFDSEGKVTGDSLYNTSTNSGYLTTFTYECK